ncbi:MAG: elongation factor G [Armatimonadetes bacterium]|nr:elongation factor G [Armatimonadota bacterium]
MARTGDIRNVALIGHRGSGKTALTEALIHAAGATNRMGVVSARNTITDFDGEEQSRQLSISAAVASFDYRGKRINLIDTPGYADFLGETYGALRVADAALLLVHGESGVEVETLKVWRYTAEYGLPVVAVITHVDGERTEFAAQVAALREALGSRITVVQMPVADGVADLVRGVVYPGGQTGQAQTAALPAGLEHAAEWRAETMEFAAENDEALLDKYMEEEDLSADEIFSGLKLGVAERSVVPVACAAGPRNVGSLALLDLMVDLLPSPAERPAQHGTRPNGEPAERPADPAGPFSALCFKAQFGESRRVILMRVWSGTVQSGATVANATRGGKERLGTIGTLLGERFTDASELTAGDICGAVKVSAEAGDTLCAEDAPIGYPPTTYPAPLISVAIHPRSRGDEEKIGAGLSQLRSEDPSFRFLRDPETEEWVLSGAGDMHLQVILAHLRSRFGVEVDTSRPKIAYRETVRRRVEAQGRHKKQTGGAGQFGDVLLRMEPLERGAGFEFSDEIFGGSVPKQYIPSVEKGARGRVLEGFLAGFPLVDLKVTLYDGSYHSVDSSDLAFQLAARIGVEACCQKADAYLLEPILNIYVTVPDDCVGDIMADLPRRRGTVMGSSGSGGLQTIEAQVPAAEMSTYATDLRSMTQGRGTFRTEFVRYDEVPHELSQKIIAERAAARAEERR